MGREARRTRRRAPVALVAAALAAVVLAASAAWAEDKSTADNLGKPAGQPAAGPPAEQQKGGAAEVPKAAGAQTAAPPEAQPPPTAVSASTAPAGDGKIELHVKNEELANVLELLSRQYELNIVASKGAKGRITADLYKVTVEQTLDAICRSAGLDWIREGNTLYIYTREEMAAMETAESRMVVEVFELQYLSAEEASKLVQPVLSSKATVAVNSVPEKGLPSGASSGTGGNSFGLPDTIVVRDYPEHIEQVRTLLKKMDRRPRQVLVEATILQVTLDDWTHLGVNFNALAGIDFRDLSTQLSPITDPTSVPNSAAVTAPVAESPFSQIRTNGMIRATNGLNIGVITNNVAFFINALETVVDTTVLSNPKVLALNKQRAEVIVGERLGYRTTTVTETTAVETVEFLEGGTQLIFRPFITDDGYIRMEIHPKVSEPDIVDELPRERTTEVTCNILVKDGHTIVIGGLFSENSSVDRRQVPGLGNIPGVGWLFRSKLDTSVRREIIVLLTPHIIDDDQTANAVGEAALADVNRRCLGVREGFSFFTRERLVCGYMQEAEKAWQRWEKSGLKNDLDKACWNMYLAHNAAPAETKVLRLRDKILSAKSGEPYSPPNWTIWDTIRDRLKAVDKAKPADGSRPPDSGGPISTPIPKGQKQTSGSRSIPIAETGAAEKTEPAAQPKTAAEAKSSAPSTKEAKRAN